VIMRSLRARLVVLCVICVLLVGAAVGYLINARNNQQRARAAAPPVARTSLAGVLSVPHIVFRNTNPRTRYGMVAAVPLTDPSGPRALTDTECDRVYAAARKVLCLSSDAGVVTTYAAHVLTEQMATLQALPLTGVPSRARLSPDGTLAATTSFIAGDSYAGGSFSTRTVISQVGGSKVGDLEDFTLVHDGQRILPTDRNYWGVTFAPDDNTFFATVKFSGQTWLVRGNIAQHRVVTLHKDAECPSLSPDGKFVVYKQRGSLPVGQWRLVGYDVATGKVTPLAEKRTVDDQVEWLDSSRVIYGIPRGGAQAATDDVWEVPADGSGIPKLLIPDAWSPAVVR